MKIGVDVDGVLADFNSAYINRVTLLTGRDLFPTRPFDIPVWDYPQHYGYTGDEIANVWTMIKQSREFWQNLPAYYYTRSALEQMALMVQKGHDFYFITSRPGKSSKAQTELWLQNHMPLKFTPTVLVVDGAPDKAAIAGAVKLDSFIDDKPSNVYEVGQVIGIPNSVVFDQPWNRTISPDVPRATNLLNYLHDLTR